MPSPLQILLFHHAYKLHCEVWRWDSIRERPLQKTAKCCCCKTWAIWSKISSQPPGRQLSTRRRLMNTFIAIAHCLQHGWVSAFLWRAQDNIRAPHRTAVGPGPAAADWHFLQARHLHPSSVSSAQHSVMKKYQKRINVTLNNADEKIHHWGAIGNEVSNMTA